MNNPDVMGHFSYLCTNGRMGSMTEPTFTVQLFLAGRLSLLKTSALLYSSEICFLCVLALDRDATSMKIDPSATLSVNEGKDDAVFRRSRCSAMTASPSLFF